MSDSEVEFQSADEGSNVDDGWEIECDFDLPDVETSTKLKSNEIKISSQPKLYDPVETEKNLKCEYEDVKPAENSSSDTIPLLHAGLDKLTVNSDSTEQYEECNVVQNEIKSTRLLSNDRGSWTSGFNSLFSTASALLAHQVSQGITNVIGAPTPEQLASAGTQEKVETFSDTPADEFSESSFGSNYFLTNVSQITKIVETTGSKIINGGLDTLETVGKKTFEVLQEGDPGLRKKRALFFQNNEKINLSQVLQEAKEKSENESQQNYNKVEVKKGYAYLLDDFQGLIHLESLELLSKQCQMKLQTVLLSYSGTQLTDIQDTLVQIKELCDFDFDDDEKLMGSEEFKNTLITCISHISVDVKTEKILRVSSFIDEKLNAQFDNEDSIHDEAISALAELTAAAMELFYKLGEMLMIDTQCQQVIIKAENLSLLNEAICCRIRSIANKYACLSTKFDADGTSNNISDIYLESSNSSSYIQDAAQLLIPILQLSII